MTQGSRAGLSSVKPKATDAQTAKTTMQAGLQNEQQPQDRGPESPHLVVAAQAE